MCATPDWTFLNSRFLRALVCFFAAKKTPFILSALRAWCRRLDPPLEGGSGTWRPATAPNHDSIQKRRLRSRGKEAAPVKDRGRFAFRTARLELESQPDVATVVGVVRRRVGLVFPAVADESEVEEEREALA